MKKSLPIYALIFVGLFTQCSTEDLVPEEIPLQAIITNTTQTVAPFTLVTLDGSQSTGPEGFLYEWIINGPDGSSILSGANDPVITFTPEKNGIYNIFLEITSNGSFSQAQAQVTASGAIILNANSFTSDILELQDVESDPAMPDYLIESDFIIPAGKSLLIGDTQNVTIGVADGAGIIVNGRIDVGSNSSSSANLNIIASGTDWKGVLIDNGSISNVSNIVINSAGGAIFDGQTDAAALIVTNGGTYTNSTNNGGSLELLNIAGDHGIIFTATASFSQVLNNSRVFNVKVPLKAPIEMFGNDFNGIFLDVYDYIHLTTPGAEVTVGSIDGQFSFNSKTYYIDGDFTAGSPISVNGAIVYMKEGAGIVGGDITVNSSTVQGLDNATWKGLASTGTVAVVSSDIIGAGSAVHNTGGFISEEAAAIYATSIAIIDGSNFTNNVGFGVYLNSFSTSGRVLNTTFTNTTGADVSLPFSIVGTTIQTGNSWSSNLPVELRSGQTSAGSAWKSLGTGNSYVATSNILINSGALTLNPGVLIRFKTGTSLTVTTKLVAAGTDNERILFDGVDGTLGSWSGMLLQGQYQMEYCTIINGGGTTFIGAQAAANVVFGSGSNLSTYPQTLNSFENNTVSLSADYGATILLGKYDPITLSVSNIFENNTNGDIKLP